MARVFISHAAADKEYADAFVDTVLRLGCGLAPEAIFYSSGEDTGIPSGEDLNHYVRNRAEEGGLVIALITPIFQTRPFCLAELGAAWSRTGQFFPLLAPGMDRGALEGILASIVIRYSHEASALDELKERVEVVVEPRTRVTTWNRQKKSWLDRVAHLAAALKQPETATLAEVARLRNELADATADYEEAAEEIANLQRQMLELAATKDAAEVKKIMLPRTEEARFEVLREAAALALGEIPSVVGAAIWHSLSNRQMGWPDPDSSEWEQISTNVEKGMLLDSQEGLSPNRQFRKVAEAWQRIQELQRFFGETSRHFDNWFEEAYEAPPDLKSSLVWNAMFNAH